MATKKRKKKLAPKKKTVKKKLIKRKVAKKRPVKRPVKKPAKKVAAKKMRMPENVVGVVTHYFPKVRAAVIKLKAPLAVGDVIKVKGHTTDFKQNITSMQIDHVPMSVAKKGQEIGLLVNSRVRQHDTVYKV